MGELRKCGEKEKHDQSSKSAVTIVSPTRAEVHKQERRWAQQSEESKGRKELLEKKQAKSEHKDRFKARLSSTQIKIFFLKSETKR